MQKILRRAEYLSKYTARRATKERKLRDKQEQRRAELSNLEVRNSTKEEIKLAQKARWDEHYRGQLAPRHDVGAKAEAYGSVNLGRSRGMRVMVKDREHCPFAVGDRVVLAGRQYRDCGKIGKVLAIEGKTQTLTMEGVNEAMLYLPEYVRMMSQAENEPQYRASLPIPWKDCKLIAALPDQKTGEIQDTIIAAIELDRPMWYHKGKGKGKGQTLERKVAGTNTKLPWPERPPRPKYESTDSDTLRIDVEERTFVPTLGIPPMPPGLIDELRHKYSKYRTRFSEEFIAKREAAAKVVEDKKIALKRAAVSPYTEMRRARQLQRIAGKGGKRVPVGSRLTSEIIQGIANLGLQNAKKQGRTLPRKTAEQFVAIQTGVSSHQLTVQGAKTRGQLIKALKAEKVKKAKALEIERVKQRNTKRNAKRALRREKSVALRSVESDV